MDLLDRAANQEELFRNESIKRATTQPTEQPDEDEHGRYCLDCGVDIPSLRIAAVNAVRCVRCQTKREKT